MQSYGKFKPGDQVRIKSSRSKVSGPGEYIGEIGVIESIGHNPNNKIRFSNGNAWFYKDDEIEQAEPEKTFQEITSEERKAFIKSITEQLFTTPEAYQKYKEVNDILARK